MDESCIATLVTKKSAQTRGTSSSKSSPICADFLSSCLRNLILHQWQCLKVNVLRHEQICFVMFCAFVCLWWHNLQSPPTFSREKYSSQLRPHLNAFHINEKNACYWNTLVVVIIQSTTKKLHLYDHAEDNLCSNKLMKSCEIRWKIVLGQS